MMRSPLWYYGGKHFIVNKLINYIPEHKKYVEVFGGGASLLFAKRPEGIEIYNDIDYDLFNFFSVLRDKEKFQEFYRLVCLTPYSRNEFYNSKNNIDKEKDDIKRAYMFFIVNRQSFSGRMSSWSYIINQSCNNMSGSVSKYLSIIELLPEIHRRIMRVQIDNRDFRDILRVYDDIDTFFYCDPPYLEETRKSFDDYKYEMTYEDHKDLINILSNIKGKVMLSGYQNDLYEQLNWKRINFDVYCHAVNARLTLKRPKRIESIWINYDLGNDLF